MRKMESKSVAEYIKSAPKVAHAHLVTLRKEIKATIPDAVETISYGTPTFDIGGKHVVHFAGYVGHIGFYPGASGIANFTKELAKYPLSKGTVQFPLDNPLPLPLIRKIVHFRAKETRAKLKQK
jgi:uncharacterized protein YdhG (YjbR/CyaY superfamily)